VRVASAPDRRAGILRAREVTPVGVAVLDDGWSTRSVRADLHVLLVDARHPTAGGLIPAGGRRLPLAALARADVCVTMHGALPDPLAARLSPGCVSARAELVPIGWLHRGALHPLGALEGRRVVALVGIARPAAFLSTLRRLGHRADRTWVLPDHHRGTWRQLQAMEAWRDTHAVVTTEKDAARLPLDAPVWALRVELRFREGEDAVRERLRAVVGA
jgi:tetraacyldisaccharide 4'-kinase